MCGRRQRGNMRSSTSLLAGCPRALQHTCIPTQPAGKGWVCEMNAMQGGGEGLLLPLGKRCPVGDTWVLQALWVVSEGGMNQLPPNIHHLNPPLPVCNCLSHNFLIFRYEIFPPRNPRYCLWRALGIFPVCIFFLLSVKWG